MSNTLVSRRGPGLVGQFQMVPVKTIPRFLTIPYICAQRILYLAREVQVFHMTSTHIARQGLHLVILLNDSVDAEKGPNEEQQDERIDLGDDLIELEVAMKQWGTEAERQDAYDARVPDIKEQYAQFFKRRFYFHNARDPESDPVFQKLLAYDSKTTKPGYSTQLIGHPNDAGVQTRAESNTRVGEELKVPVFEANPPLPPLDQIDVVEVVTLKTPSNRPSHAVLYDSDRSSGLRDGGDLQADIERLFSEMRTHNATNPRAFRELKRRADPIVAHCNKYRDIAEKNELRSIFTTMANEFIDAAGDQPGTISNRMNPNIYTERKQIIMRADQKLNRFQAPPEGRSDLMRKANLDDDARILVFEDIALIAPISEPIGSTAAEPAKSKTRYDHPQAFTDSEKRIPRTAKLSPIFIPRGMQEPGPYLGSDPSRSPSPEEEGHTQTTAAHLKLETKLLNVEIGDRTPHPPPRPIPKNAPVSIPRDARGRNNPRWMNDPLWSPSPEQGKLKPSTFHQEGSQSSLGASSQWASQIKTAYEILEKKLVEVKDVDLTPSVMIPISDMCFEGGKVITVNISLDQTFGELADIVINNDADANALLPDFWSKKIDHDQNRVSSSGVTWEWQHPDTKVLNVIAKKECLGIEKVTKEGEYVVVLVEKDGKEGPMAVDIPRSHRQSASKHFQKVVFPDDNVLRVLELQSGGDASERTFDRRCFSPFTNSVFIEVRAGSHEDETGHSALGMDIGVKSSAVNQTTVVRGPTGVKEKQRIFGSKMAGENMPGVAELQFTVASAEGNSEHE